MKDSSLKTLSSLTGDAIEVVPASMEVHAAYLTCLAYLDGAGLEDLSVCYFFDDEVGCDGIVRD